MKKIFYTFLISLISFQLIVPSAVIGGAPSVQIADFLCEKGILYYNQGRDFDALTEFKKALLANPESGIAKEFISRIEGQHRQEYVLPEALSKEALLEKLSVVHTYLDQIELQQAVISEKRPLPKKLQLLLLPEPGVEALPEVIIDMSKTEEGKDVIEIQTHVEERLLMRGKNITRFLITEPGFLSAERRGIDELLLEPQEPGLTYIHIWDDSGRKTFKLTIGPRRFLKALEEEFLRRKQEAELPASFKMSYSISGDSFMTGSGFQELERKTHTLSYSSSIIGETPFGNFDTAVQASRTNLKTYRISNLRMGITNGHYDQFKDINIRWFDFNPDFASFGFPASDLRGVRLSAPMFDRTFDYTGFWGAIPRGEFTALSAQSGLSKTKEAWLEGLGMHYRLGPLASFKGFYVHGYGPERTKPVLTDKVSGFGMNYRLGSFNLDTEMAYDMLQHVSYTARSSYILPKLRLSLSMTESNKDFASVFGGQPSGGFTSGALSLDYRPTTELTITNSFRGNRDKVFGNPARPTRPNYFSDTRLKWVPDLHTEFELGYLMDDQIGSNSPSVIETKEVIVRKKLFFLKRLSTFLSYQNRKSKNYTAPALDFNNNRILAGLNFRVISDLYCYYNREFNLLRRRLSHETAQPFAQEIGLNYYRRIFDSPFYTYLRLRYRDEEDTESQLSYLGGEDRLEGEAQLNFRPNPNSETFLKVRVANVWAEKESTSKHLDLDVSWGIRLLWDTGLCWQSVGHFDGFVFYDDNGDGLKQAKEKGVKGIEVFGPKGKSAVTDGNGYYKITGIAGKRTLLRVNLETLPKGYNLTTPIEREVEVVHTKTKKVNFGIATRSEISGLVFNDANGNGQYDFGEEPIKGVVILLDNKERAVSSLLGEYMFRKILPGEHTLTLDLNSLPVKFIPKVPIYKKVRVLEGTTFIYNVPVQETRQELK